MSDNELFRTPKSHIRTALLYRSSNSSLPIIATSTNFCLSQEQTSSLLPTKIRQSPVVIGSLKLYGNDACNLAPTAGHSASAKPTIAGDLIIPMRKVPTLVRASSSVLLLLVCVCSLELLDKSASKSRGLPPARQTQI